MTMVLGEARSRSGGRGDLLARAAKAAVSQAGPGSLTRLAGAAAVGFVLGAGALGVRKLAMQAATGIAGDWMAALKADHRLADGLFELLGETQDRETARRHLLISKIAYALAKHQFEEEHVIYPALGADGEATPRRLDGEHFEMKALMHALIEGPKDGPEWLAKSRALHKLVREHAREEEEIVFPALHGRLSRAQNRKLTLAMHREGLKLA
jgi:hemerythrin superfamily protein